jgi:hypothetical protein
MTRDVSSATLGFNPGGRDEGATECRRIGFFLAFMCSCGGFVRRERRRRGARTADAKDWDRGACGNETRASDGRKKICGFAKRTR